MAEEKINAWTWLSRARTIKREVSVLMSTKQATKDALTKVTQNYSSDGASSSKDPHKFDRLAELESLIDQRVNELAGVQMEIIHMINRLEDGRQRMVLLDYYVSMKTLEQTAVDMSYSYAHTKRIRAQGVGEVEKILHGN